jgi:EmrB/QacA subfamily drug resistance transporter
VRPDVVLARTSQRSALATVLVVLFLTFLDTTIVSVTLGSIESDMSAGVIPLQWVLNGYSLVFASLMLTAGALGDRFGRKRVMLAGVVIFCVGSLMCALAPAVGIVIAGRAVMGVGAAASEPGTLSIIRQLFPERAQRARALGAWSAVAGLALAAGPVIGGVLVGASGWRAVFWFNLALSVALVAAVVRYVPESKDPQTGRVDVPGFVLGTTGIAAVIFALIFGELYGYRAWWVVGLFVAGGLALLAFGPVEARVKAPMLDLRYMRQPIVTVALFAAFAVYFGVFAIFFLTALYLDIGLAYTGWQLAGMFAPMAVAIVGGGLAAGRWVARDGPRPPMVVGCMLAALGTLLARYELAGGTQLTTWVLAAALAIAGLGFGITVVPMTAAVLTHVPGRHSGMAASATNTARQLGAVVGVAVLGAIVNAHLVDAVNEQFSGILAGSRANAMQILETGGNGAVDLTNIPAPFITAFRDGLAVSLVVATVLILLAGLAAAVVPIPAEDAETSEAIALTLGLPELDTGG